jgi:hypothetical protein
MNKYEIIYNLLKSLNIPVAYDHFDSNKKVNPPFMTYRELEQDTFKGDNKTYFRDYNFEIEVVTIKKEPNLQNRIEELLTNNNIPYDVSTEVWDEEEKIYHIFYEI